VESILNVLDDHGFKTQTIYSSNYSTPFLLNVLDWEKRLSIIADVIEEWIKCQKSYTYLEPLFMAFQGNSENENSWIKEIYKKLNEDWRIIMHDAHENPKIM